jgi:RNA polymerase sigma-70 factor (ECF subfamily)
MPRAQVDHVPAGLRQRGADGLFADAGFAELRVVQLRPAQALRDGAGRKDLLVCAEPERARTLGAVLPRPSWRARLVLEWQFDLMSTRPGAEASGASASAPKPALTGLAQVDRQRRDAELAELVHAASLGSASAFEAFYDRTAGYAHALARRMLRPDDLDDVLADAYFQAWREAVRFDAARGSAVTWLLTLVRSRALDLLRQRRAAVQAETPLDAADSPSNLPGPDEVLAMARAGSRLHAALSTLSVNERWVLGLAYFRELTHGQIANCTGLPLGSVKSLILRSQVKLREQLGTE